MFYFWPLLADCQLFERRVFLDGVFGATSTEAWILVSNVLPRGLSPSLYFCNVPVAGELSADHGPNVLFPELACRIAQVVATALRGEFAMRHEQRADADSEGFRKPLVRAFCAEEGRWSVVDPWRWKRQLESGAERRRLRC